MNTCYYCGAEPEYRMVRSCEYCLNEGKETEVHICIKCHQLGLNVNSPEKHKIHCESYHYSLDII